MFYIQICLCLDLRYLLLICIFGHQQMIDYKRLVIMECIISISSDLNSSNISSGGSPSLDKCYLLHLSHRPLQKSVCYDIFTLLLEKTRDLSLSPSGSPCLPTACVSTAEEGGCCSTHTHAHKPVRRTHTNTSSQPTGWLTMSIHHYIAKVDALTTCCHKCDRCFCV